MITSLIGRRKKAGSSVKRAFALSEVILAEAALGLNAGSYKAAASITREATSRNIALTFIVVFVNGMQIQSICSLPFFSYVSLVEGFYAI